MCVLRPREPTEAQLAILVGAALRALDEAPFAAFLPLLSMKKGGNGCSPAGFKDSSGRLGGKARV